MDYLKCFLKGRLLLFNNLNEDSINKLKTFLTRRDRQDNEYCALFFDKELGFYTYFGYLDLLKEHFNLDLINLNKEQEVKFTDDEIRNCLNEVVLYDYQVIAVRRCLETKYGTVVACVSSGKTIMMSAIIKLLNQKSLIVVPTQQLLSQLKKNFEIYLGCEIGEISGNEVNIKDITVGSYTSIARQLNKNTELMKQFTVCIFDETHTTQQCATGRKINKFYLNNSYVLGFTGTLYRNTSSISDFIMLGFTGKPIVYIPLKYLWQRDFIAKPIVIMTNIKKSKKQFIKSWHIVYKNFIEKNRYRNQIIANYINKLSHFNLLGLTLVNTKNHAQNIYQYLDNNVKEKTIIIHGANQGFIPTSFGLSFQRINYNKIIDKLKKKEYIHCIATPVFAQGTDIPELQYLVLGFSGKAYTQVIQRIGRVVRKSKNKKYAFILDFYDDINNYLVTQSKQRLQIYQSEDIPIKFNINEFFNYIEKEYNNEVFRK